MNEDIDHDAREKAIVQLARRYFDLPDDFQPSAEELRRFFLATAVGHDAPALAETPTNAELDLTRLDEHVLGITVWVRDRAELNKLRARMPLALTAQIETLPGRVEPEIVAFHFGGRGGAKPNSEVDAWDAVAQWAFRVPGHPDSRESRLDPGAVTAALAVFYLTKSGGGRLSHDKAIKLMQAEIDLLKPGTDGRVHSYLDERQLRRTLTTVRERYGPLS